MLLRAVGLFSGGSFGFFCRGCGCLSFGFSCSNFCFLLSHEFGLGLVLGYFILETLLGGKFLLVGHSALLSFDTSYLLSLPGIETTLSFSFVESALANAALEVLHEHNAFARQDGAYGVSGLSTYVDPIQSPLEVESNCSRISVRIV